MCCIATLMFIFNDKPSNKYRLFIGTHFEMYQTVTVNPLEK